MVATSNSGGDWFFCLGHVGGRSPTVNEPTLLPPLYTGLPGLSASGRLPKCFRSPVPPRR
eukprot:11386738-Alexandrium_andersonii.AAC.1